MPKRLSTFSQSIRLKVHQGLHKRTKGNALAILARTTLLGAACIKLTEVERAELERTLHEMG